jgi:hypothetical protein
MTTSLSRKILALLTFTAFAGLYACGGGAAVGETCAKENDVGECASGALCTKASTGELTCLKVCTAQSDCATGENCTGTTGSDTKVCQPSDTGAGCGN